MQVQRLVGGCKLCLLCFSKFNISNISNIKEMFRLPQFGSYYRMIHQMSKKNTSKEKGRNNPLSITVDDVISLV